MAKVVERDIEVKVGSILHNMNGTDYVVVQSTNERGETTVYSKTRFPWVCIAHNIDKYDDGTICWSHSTQVGFLHDLCRYVEKSIRAKSCFIDCPYGWDDDCYNITGILQPYTPPSWDESSEDEAGWVFFKDDESRVWATDGEKIMFLN